MSAGFALFSAFRFPLSLLPVLLWPVAAFVLAWLALLLSAYVAFGGRVPEGTHWTERARRTFPGLKWVNTGPLVTAVLLLWIWRDDLFDGSLAGRLLGLLTGGAAFLGSLLAASWVAGRRRNPVRAGETLRALAISLLFFLPALVPGVVSTSIMGWHATGGGPLLVMGLTVALVTWLLAGGAFGVARLLGLVLPSDARVTGILDEAVRRGGILPRRHGILRWRSANALAFPLNQAVLVTRGALEVLEDEELVLLCLHEMAHLREPRAVAWARAASAFLYLPLLWCGPLYHRFGFWGVAGSLLFLFVGARLFRRMARRMEVLADAGATAGPGSGAAYARMLEKVHEQNLIPAVLGPRDSTHPNLYDRMRVAGATPAYPRPLLPPRGRVFWAMAVAVVGLSLAAPWVQSGIANLLARSNDQAIFEQEMK